MKSVQTKIETLSEAGVALGAIPPVAPGWYVVETNVHAERQAKFHLERKKIEIYLPMRATLSKRTDAARATPLFPGYLFAQVAEHDWADVFAAISVRGVVGSRNRPNRRVQALVEDTKRREERGIVQMAKAEPDKMPHRAGDKLKVVGGAFDGFDAVFAEMIDERRVLILLALFGHPTRATVPLSAVRARS